MKLILSSVFFLISNICWSQLPKSDIYLLNIENDQLRKIEFLNHFNKNAYNNQPSFISNDEIVLTSNLEDNQTDIVLLDLRKKQFQRLTNTKESEYSPRAYEGNTFTTVRVELDGTTQSLWEYPLDLSNRGQRLLSDLNNIGYYMPMINYKMALFLIEEDMELVVADMRTDRLRKHAKGIGRCFQLSKRATLLFVDKSGSSPKIREWNPVNGIATDYCPALPGAEDFVLYGNQEDILMGLEGQIYRYSQNAKTWVSFLDLASYGIDNITRMAYRNNQLILVDVK